MKTQTDYAVNYDIKIMKRIYIIYEKYNGCILKTMGNFSKVQKLCLFTMTTNVKLQYFTINYETIIDDG